MGATADISVLDGAKFLKKICAKVPFEVPSAHQSDRTKDRKERTKRGKKESY